MVVVLPEAGPVIFGTLQYFCIHKLNEAATCYLGGNPQGFEISGHNDAVKQVSDFYKRLIEEREAVGHKVFNEKYDQWSA